LSIKEAPVPARPLPALDEANTDFWTGGAVGELRISRCAECGHWSHPPTPRCPLCFARQMRPQPASGCAVLHTFTINHHPWYPGLPTPYVVGIVELVEQPGLRLTTTIVGCDPDDVEVGMPVRVLFHQLEDVWLPFFEPDGSR
jgi:uncharacterized OB-fold protein